MSTHASTAKLAAALPKEIEANGLLEIAAELIAAAQQGSKRVLPVLMLLDVKKIEYDTDKGLDTAVLRMRRVEVPDRDDWSHLQRMLLRAYERRMGNAVLPFELEQDVKTAFEEIDLSEGERQELAREDMSPADELRKHLEIVHRDSTAQGYTDEGAAQQHRHDHEHAEINHDTGWIGWTLQDLEDRGPYTLYFSHTDDVWTLTKPNDPDTVPLQAAAEVTEVDVALAQTWAADVIAEQDRTDVIRWRESPVLPGGYIPVLDDAAGDGAVIVPGPEGVKPPYGTPEREQWDREHPFETGDGWTDEVTGLKSGHAAVFDANDAEAREAADDDDDANG